MVMVAALLVAAVLGDGGGVRMERGVCERVHHVLSCCLCLSSVTHTLLSWVVPVPVEWVAPDGSVGFEWHVHANGRGRPVVLADGHGSLALDRGSLLVLMIDLPAEVQPEALVVLGNGGHVWDVGFVAAPSVTFSRHRDRGWES